MGVITRVNPQEDVVIIAGTHNHAMDASLPELGAPGTPLWQRRGSKMLIDATFPLQPTLRRATPSSVSAPATRSFVSRTLPLRTRSTLYDRFLNGFLGRNC